VALEIAKAGIRVNGVAPGPTDTGMLTRFTGTPENNAALVRGVPMGRLGRSEELANAIVFIASELHTSPAMSSTSMAVTPLTDHVRARTFAPRRSRRPKIVGARRYLEAKGKFGKIVTTH